MVANLIKVNPHAELLDIVIINWNSTSQLQSCLNSFIQACKPEDVSIVVVDNSANVNDIEEFPFVRLLNPEKNLGFGRGCNLGAAQGKAPFILFLNPDIYFFSDTLTKLLAFLKLDKMPDSVGILGVQLVNSDGSVQKNVARFPEFKDLFPRMLGLDRLFPRLFKSHYVRDMDYTRTQFVDQVPGAFFLIKRPVFEQMGGFDERFFMYYEDVDLSYRAQIAGWDTLYLPAIKVTHSGGGTTDVIKATRLFYVLRSKILFVRKHFGRAPMVFLTVGIYTLELIGRISNAILKLSGEKLLNTIKAYVMLSKYLVKDKKERLFKKNAHPSTS